MPTCCYLVSCDEVNVFSRWGDIVKALERSPGFDWQALSQKMRSGGSRTAKRIYYLGWRGTLSKCVSAVSHLALCASVEQSLLDAEREQLSTCISAAAISNVPDISYSEVRTMTNYHVQPKTLKRSSAVVCNLSHDCWHSAVRTKKTRKWHPGKKKAEIMRYRKIQLSPFLWSCADPPPPPPSPFQGPY